MVQIAPKHVRVTILKIYMLNWRARIENEGALQRDARMDNLKIIKLLSFYYFEVFAATIVNWFTYGA
jgi:hypothetical protein